MNPAKGCVRAAGANFLRPGCAALAEANPVAIAANFPYHWPAFFRVRRAA
ncbi:MAG: hypothetical protein WAN10_00075 [Candidatus Acidiferrales bacterium]